jgi:hypothetical protein
MYTLDKSASVSLSFKFGALSQNVSVLYNLLLVVILEMSRSREKYYI